MKSIRRSSWLLSVAVFAAALLTVSLTGCSTTGGIPIIGGGAGTGASTTQFTNTVERLAYIGTRVRLRTNPQDRPAFEQAAAALTLFSGATTPGQLGEVLSKLPIGQLSGDNGALFLEGLVLLESLGGNPISLNQFADVQPLAAAAQRGIARALAETAPPPAPAAPPLLK